MVRMVRGGRHRGLAPITTDAQLARTARVWSQRDIGHNQDMGAVVTGQACVLVVEDEVSIRDALSELLRRDGFDVHACATGSAALPAVGSVRPGVILLDLGLPDVNGFDLLRAIRDRTGVPVIVLSGRGSESDRVLALELGADDYVLKPFLTRELVARIRAHLRRSGGSNGTDGDGRGGAVVAGDLRIDPASREVRVGADAVALTAKEFDLLHFLAASPRQVFRREQLLERVWGSSADWQQEATVTEHVHRLRQKIGSARIVTIRGVGYRFEPDREVHVAE